MRHLKIVLPIMLAISILISGVAVIFELDLLGKKPNDSISSSDTSSEEAEPVFDFTKTYEKDMPATIKAAALTPGVDFIADGFVFENATKEIDSIISELAQSKFNAINVNVNYLDGVIFNNDVTVNHAGDLMNYIYGVAHTYNMTVITTINISGFAKTSISDKADFKVISKLLTSPSLLNNSDMLVIDGYMPTEEEPEITIVSSTNSTTSSDTSSPKTESTTSTTSSEVKEPTEEEITAKIEELTLAMKKYYHTIAAAKETLYVGVAVRNRYTKGEEDTNEDSVYLLDDGYADVKAWLNDGAADFAMVDITYPISSSKNNFKDEVKYFEETFGHENNIYYTLSYSLYGSSGDWKKPDQILGQLMHLADLGNNSFIFDSYLAFKNDKTESKTVVLRFFQDKISTDYILTNLSISNPKKQKYTTYDSTVSFNGASDPEFILKLNGKEVERNDIGYFSMDFNLSLGKNTFKFEHKGTTKTYTITYKKVVIKSVSPTTAITLDPGSSASYEMVAIAGSTATITINGKSYTMKEEPILDDLGNKTEYSTFQYTYTAPDNLKANTSYGEPTFKAVSKYGTETKKGGKLTVKKNEQVNTPITPITPSYSSTGAYYLDVGKTYVAEVLSNQIETVDWDDTGSYSRPTNNYLPKGTIDFCHSGTKTYSSIPYKTLRYGKMVDGDQLKITKGTVPDTNQVNVSAFNDDGQFTEMTFSVAWKAPFMLEIKEQAYRNTGDGGNRDYTMKSITFSYVDLTFCYADAVTGELTIPEDNPLFSNAALIKNTKDYTLRLYLKKTGAFYGWSANYNSNGELVFKFLNPAKITEADNQYGYSLEGVKIGLDIGHYGINSGASTGNITEAHLNYVLAMKVKNELLKTGATVIIIEGNTPAAKIQKARDVSPDFILSMHRNWSGSAAYGFISYHFNQFTAKPAEHIFNTTASLYNQGDSLSKWSSVKWHPYYLSRVCVCPVVLTENGFMSNAKELSKITNDDFNQQCAEAMTRGIVNYFKSIQ